MGGFLPIALPPRYLEPQMKLPALIAATATAAISVASARPADAQEPAGGFSLNQFEPTPAGDALFGVPSPSASGSLVPRVMAVFDYAHRPVRLAGSDDAVVSAQGYVRLDASLALWDRLLVSVDFPLAVVQDGDDPDLAGFDFVRPTAPQVGDLRFGLRARLFGEDPGPIQLGLGGYLFVPTGSETEYTGEGAVRGAPHVVLGGRIGLSSSVGLVWSVMGGAELTGSDNPQTITFGGGAGLLLGGDLLQIGPELYGSAPLGGELRLATIGAELPTKASTNAEVIVGAKLRVLGGLVLGAAAGPGILQGVGTPTVRAIGTIGWAPPASSKSAGKPAGSTKSGGKTASGPTPEPTEVVDTDNDGIADHIDACPAVKGIPSADATQDGCPPPDRDKDGVHDVDDACPNLAGLRSSDGTKNGCPADTDNDGVHDGVDACLNVKGVASSDARKNGCPADRDEDGIADASDACPEAKGSKSEDRVQNGCPEDQDGDGIKYPKDACPTVKGPTDLDPRQNGCPKVQMTGGEIVLREQVQFQVYGKTKGETVSPMSKALLTEVRDTINQNPDILQIEVQGHTDDSGDDAFNLKLSQDRADAVRQWLIDEGIPADKLVARGYGYTKPIADNRIRQGRLQNRRVQFVIIKKK
jgi:outer membrane protein OmpA-like peptidoglycan-associated protein